MSGKVFYWDQDLAASDFFCGAGGLGWGVEQAGAKLALAVNHDARSIATYKRNFPFADVRCSWMEDINWTEAPDTLLGVGSPECRYHSPGAGKKLNNQMKCPFPGWTDYDTSPEVEKSRSSMWQVYRATEAKAASKRPFHSLIFENVVEVEKWRDYGEWEKKMLALGYEHQILYLNAMHFGVAQARDRWIAVFWRKGAKRPDLDYRPTAPCVHCGRDVQAVQCWKKTTKKRGKYDYRLKGQYTYNCPRCARQVQPYYTPAAAVIDFSDRGIKLGERRQHQLRPLKWETMQRIRDGIERFFKHPQTPPLSARNVPAIDGIAPFWITYYSDGKPYSIYEPFCTFSTSERCGLVFPPEDGSMDIQQCSFRMLNEAEVRGGSGLPAGYKIVADSKEEVVRQCGHMVPPPLAQWVTQRVISPLQEVSA
jgi:DNA (cytosine-5)-methyltransferase 1